VIEKRNLYFARIIAGVLVGAILTYWGWNESRSRVVLLPGGKAVFYRGAFFNRRKFDLSRSIDGRTWQIVALDSRDLESGEFAVPYECRYNKYRTLRLEGSGKVYIVDKDANTRQELRVVDGEWSYDADDRWVSIFEIEEFADEPEE